MLKDFDQFFRFCFEHGGYLRNHSQFAKMARELRDQIEVIEQHLQSDSTCPEHGEPVSILVYYACGCSYPAKISGVENERTFWDGSGLSNR